LEIMLELAIRAAREAGHVLAESYNRPHEITSKGLRDILTEADLAAEKTALEIIRRGCPDARFVSEESNASWQESEDHPVWIVDPLDGTTNYAHGLPMFSVSVGMARHGEACCGAVYDPLLDQLFSAERGGGAYLNEQQRLHVSECDTLIDSLVLLDWPRVQTLRETSARFLARLAPQVDTVRSRGSAALGFCSIAAGWGEAYFQYTLGPWDVAAGLVIAEEAGATVTDLHGQPRRLDKPDWLVTNGLVHEKVLAVGPFA
jgi:myo-inositol-1(or 4)-monophosphatase